MEKGKGKKQTIQIINVNLNFHFTNKNNHKNTHCNINIHLCKIIFLQKSVEFLKKKTHVKSSDIFPNLACVFLINTYFLKKNIYIIKSNLCQNTIFFSTTHSCKNNIRLCKANRQTPK